MSLTHWCFQLCRWWNQISACATVWMYHSNTVQNLFVEREADIIWAVMSEFKMWAFWMPVLAESLGMIFFVFIGLSAAIGHTDDSHPDQEIKVAFAFGFVVATLAQYMYRSHQWCPSESCHHPGPPGQLTNECPQSLFLHNSSDFGSSGWQCHCVWY